MKVYSNKYRNHWLSPYTICEKICWWRGIDYDEPWVERANTILTPVCTVLMKFLDVVHPKIDYVKIDRWDTWSMDSTLSPIILPMLRQLKQDQHGAPHVNDADVPANLRSTTKSAQKAKKDSWSTDGNHFRRWDWVLDQMIWSFEQLCDDDNDAQFHTGEHDMLWEPSDIDSSGKPLTYKMKRGSKDTHNWDKKGWIKHNARIQHGLELFGKYFRSLWD